MQADKSGNVVKYVSALSQKGLSLEKRAPPRCRLWLVQEQASSRKRWAATKRKRVIQFADENKERRHESPDRQTDKPQRSGETNRAIQEWRRPSKNCSTIMSLLPPIASHFGAVCANSRVETQMILGSSRDGVPQGCSAHGNEDELLSTMSQAVHFAHSAARAPGEGAQR